MNEILEDVEREIARTLEKLDRCDKEAFQERRFFLGRLKKLMDDRDSVVRWSEEIERVGLSKADQDILEGREARESVVFSGITRGQIVAVGRYSQDGDDGDNVAINKYYRSQKNATPTRLEEQHIATDFFLSQMFDQAGGIKRPIRVFRGIKRKYAKGYLQTGIYADAAYGSCSYDIRIAAHYSKDERTIVVMDLPVGTRAVSIESWSEYPFEREILLDRGTTMYVNDVRLDKSGYLLLYVGGRK